jgi:hypothetical protein
MDLLTQLTAPLAPLREEPRFVALARRLGGVMLASPGMLASGSLRRRRRSRERLDHQVSRLR